MSSATNGWCEYGDHPISEFHGGYYIYSDSARNLNDIVICKPCYAKHILRYFPESSIAEYIRRNPTEYKLDEQTTVKGGIQMVHGIIVDEKAMQIGLFDALATVRETQIEQSPQKLGGA